VHKIVGNAGAHFGSELKVKSSLFGRNKSDDARAKELKKLADALEKPNDGSAPPAKTNEKAAKKP
jgi:hypothetical protein